MSESHGTIGAIEDQVAETVRRSFPSRPPGLYPMVKEERLTGEQAVERLPASIRVGPFDYAIEKMTPNQSGAKARWGEWAPQTSSIAIAQNIPTAVKAADTFMHEVNHGIWYAWGLEKGDDQERMVGQFATGWAQVYRDNSWLLDWLKECLR